MADAYRIDWGELEIHEGESIGVGQFGEVFKASYVGMDVAIKRLSSGSDEESQKYLMRELDIYLRLQHPNIVQLMGVTVSDGQAYLVMEYMAKGSLEAIVANASLDLPWDLRIRYALGIAKAVAFVHGRGILHRDIKSANVLVSETDDCKLCDFGLSRQSSSANFLQTIVGTPLWMAPETLDGEYGAAADVFSVGCVIYELIARRDPPERKLGTLMKMEVDDVSEYIPIECPYGFYRVFRECVYNEPERRPSAANVVKQLNALRLHMSKITSPRTELSITLSGSLDTDAITKGSSRSRRKGSTPRSRKNSKGTPRASSKRSPRHSKKEKSSPRSSKKGTRKAKRTGSPRKKTSSASKHHDGDGAGVRMPSTTSLTVPCVEAEVEPMERDGRPECSSSDDDEDSFFIVRSSGEEDVDDGDDGDDGKGSVIKNSAEGNGEAVMTSASSNDPLTSSDLDKVLGVWSDKYLSTARMKSFQMKSPRSRAHTANAGTPLSPREGALRTVGTGDFSIADLSKYKEESTTSPIKKVDVDDEDDDDGMGFVVDLRSSS